MLLVLKNFFLSKISSFFKSKKAYAEHPYLDELEHSFWRMENIEKQKSFLEYWIKNSKPRLAKFYSDEQMELFDDYAEKKIESLESVQLKFIYRNTIDRDIENGLIKVENNSDDPFTISRYAYDYIKNEDSRDFVAFTIGHHYSLNDAKKEIVFFMEYKCDPSSRFTPIHEFTHVAQVWSNFLNDDEELFLPDEKRFLLDLKSKFTNGCWGTCYKEIPSVLMEFRYYYANYVASINKHLREDRGSSAPQVEQLWPNKEVDPLMSGLSVEITDYDPRKNLIEGVLNSRLYSWDADEPQRYFLSMELLLGEAMLFSYRFGRDRSSVVRSLIENFDDTLYAHQNSTASKIEQLFPEGADLVKWISSAGSTYYYFKSKYDNFSNIYTLDFVIPQNLYFQDEYYGKNGVIIMNLNDANYYKLDPLPTFDEIKNVGYDVYRGGPFPAFVSQNDIYGRIDTYNGSPTPVNIDDLEFYFFESAPWKLDYPDGDPFSGSEPTGFIRDDMILDMLNKIW